MNTIEKQAQWYATKLILVCIGIIATLFVIGYMDLFYLFVVVVSMFAVMLAGALYSDAYDRKLLELMKNERTNSKAC